MLTQEAVDHFGSRIKVAKALNVTRAAIYLWGDVVPQGRAFQLQTLTQGLLKVNPTLYAANGDKLPRKT